jgi:hypothetical protein
MIYTGFIIVPTITLQIALARLICRTEPRSR